MKSIILSIKRLWRKIFKPKVVKHSFTKEEILEYMEQHKKPQLKKSKDIIQQAKNEVKAEKRKQLKRKLKRQQQNKSRKNNR